MALTRPIVVGFAAALAIACGTSPATTSTASTAGPGATGSSGTSTSTSTSTSVSSSSSSGSSSGSSSSGSSSSSSSSSTSSSSSSSSSSTSSTGGSSGTTGVVDAGPECAVEDVPGTCMDTSACSAQSNYLSTPGLCPGPANIQCCTPYSTALCDPSIVQLPNAAFTTEAPGQGGCPAGMIAVDTFCIDQFEASLVALDDGGSWSPYENPGTALVKAVSVQGAIPQAYISGDEASAACVNAGKRLCSDTEWLRACQGPSGTTYPYGNTDELGVCNDHRDEHPAVEYYGTTASWIYSELNNACLDQLPLTVDPAGSLPGCVTAEGAYDMMGNVHEWTADPAGTFRGGYFMDTSLNGPGCLYATTAHVTSYWDYSTGFRCCADHP